MNLLLLLSALLSALTGIGGSTRVPEAATISARVLSVERSSRSHVQVAARPAQAALTLMAVAAPRDRAVPVVASPPLYASRRRE